MECLFCEVLKAYYEWKLSNNTYIPTILGLLVGDFLFRGFPNEVDLLESIGSEQFAYEIKSGKTYSADYAHSLKYWAGLSSADAEHCNIVYGGEKPMKMSEFNVLTINDI